MFVAKNELCLGKMSERFKELVLKTSVSKETVGSNPTLSATYDEFFLEEYSSWWRGAPAKGVGRVKPARGFKSLFLRH